MSTFTLAISCLTTSNLPWFKDLTFQVPMQYYSSQHQTLLLSPVPSTAGCCLCFGSIPSLFLELFLHWSHILHRFSRQEYWRGLPFPSPVDHILSDYSTMTRLSWVAPHSMAYSFIELDKAVVRVIRMVSFLWSWFQSVCPLMPSHALSQCLLFYLGSQEDKNWELIWRPFATQQEQFCW